MAKRTADDALLADCEPYFLDGVLTIARFAQRTQQLVRKTVDRHWDSLVEALGFQEDEISLLDYWDPDKFQKVLPNDGACIGVKFKVSNLVEGGFYRYWEVEEKSTGIEAYLWIKVRSKLDQLGKEIDGVPDEPPGPRDSWDFYTSNIGTYFMRHELGESEIGELDLRLDELVAYYISVMTKVGGVKKRTKGK
jgi:hypothetical protein